MLMFILSLFVIFCITCLYYSIILAIKLDLLLSYWLLWTPELRKAICPNGLLAALLHDD